MILTCEPVDGKTAQSLRIVDWAFPRAELEEQARVIVERIAQLPAHAQSAAKRCIAAAGEPSMSGFEMERELGGALLESPRTQALIGAFLERNAGRA
jgi:enoyl-CoA hydratase/carnithine racemase